MCHQPSRDALYRKPQQLLPAGCLERVPAAVLHPGDLLDRHIQRHGSDSDQVHQLSGPLNLRRDQDGNCVDRGHTGDSHCRSQQAQLQVGTDQWRSNCTTVAGIRGSDRRKPDLQQDHQATLFGAKVAHK